MPYSFDLLDEEQKKQQDQQGGGEGGGAPAMTGGGDSFGGAGGGAKPFNAESGTQKQGSGFVNIDKYMQANQGNNFGGQFTGKVQGDVSGAKEGLQKNAGDFTSASNQGTTRWNDVGDAVKGIVDNAGDGLSQDDVSKYQGYAGAKYQGPDSFLGSAYGAQAQGGVNKAGQEAKALQSEGGRFALLDQFYGRPKYSTGEKSLDNLLVQNAPGVAAKAQSIGGQAKQLTTDADQTTQGLNNLVTSNRQLTSEAAKQSKDYLGGAQTGFQSDLEKRYKDYTDQTNAYNDARRSDLSDDALDADTLGLTGLGEGSNLYDLNLSNYLKESPLGSVGEFANDKDYARYLALSQLAGEDPSLLSTADRAKAGTANGKLGVDKDKLSADLSKSGASYTSQLNDVNSKLQSSQDRANYLKSVISSIGPYNPGNATAVGEEPQDGNYNYAQTELMELNRQMEAMKAQQARLSAISNRKVSKA